MKKTLMKYVTNFFVYRYHSVELICFCLRQESPAIADKPARRESLPKIAPIRRAYNVVANNTGLASFVWLLLSPKSANSREIH